MTEVVLIVDYAHESSACPTIFEMLEPARKLLFCICGKKPIKWSIWCETEYYVMHLFLVAGT
jgi:hypothetical protein